jgi:hypothetical protein
MNKSESVANLAVALVNVQAEIHNPKNTADNPFYKSKYCPLQDVLNLTRPILSKHGLSVIQSPSGDGESISIHTMIIHTTGEWIEFDPLKLKAEKLTPQGAGSAITYGRRYSLSAVVGIASEDDDDGNTYEKPNKLSDAQVKRLYAIAKSNNYGVPDVKKAVMALGKTQVEDLTKQEYDKLIERMEAKK